MSSRRKLADTQRLNSGRITVGPEGGLAHLKDLAAPAKHVF